MSRVRRVGFTLVELLVVIAIIGILIALLLPAVQAAREAARRSQCTNNLKQLMLGCHNYHDVYKSFPSSHIEYAANCCTPATTTGLNHSGWELVLPFVEQKPLYDQIDFRFPSGPYNSSGSPGGNPLPVPALTQQVSTTQLEMFICPSDDGPLTMNSGSPAYDNLPVLAARTNYDFSTHSLYTYYGYSWEYIGQNYPLERRANGINARCRFADLKDGSSNAAFIVETTRRVYNGFATAWAYRGHVMTGHDLAQQHGQARGINDWMYAFIPSTKLVGRLGNWGTSGSLHPGGAMVALGDGSVRFLSASMSLVMLDRLAFIGDGQILQLD